MNDGFKLVKKTTYINESGEFTSKEEKVIARYNDKGYLYNNRSDFLKTFLNKPYPEELTWNDRGRLGRLEHELKEGQLLAYRGHSGIEPHTVSTIAEIIELNERYTREFLKRAKRAGVIGVAIIDDKKYYLINPMYKLHGNRVSLTTFIVFQEQLKTELPEWVYNKFMEDYNLSNTNIIVLE